MLHFIDEGPKLKRQLQVYTITVTLIDNTLPMQHTIFI